MVAVYCYVMAGIESAKRRFENGEKGATAVEYGIMVALIAVVIIAAVTTLGGNIKQMFEGVSGRIPVTVP